MIPSGMGGPNYHQINPNIPLQIGGVEVKIPPPANPVYVPLRTTAVSVSIMGENQPANPYWFSSLGEATDIRDDVVKNCPGIPTAAVVLRDAPEYYNAPLIYGNDGRRVYVLEFFVKIDGFMWHILANCGMLMWQRFLYPNHRWALAINSSTIIRDPTTPDSTPPPPQS